jgi:uncharacterized protein (DUF849 family)
MPKHRVVSVATAGLGPRKRDAPALPVTPGEQIECTHTAAA